MSGSNAVIAGTYSEFKQVKSRNVLQIIVEVPMERAKEALDLLGVPSPAEEQWVAIAPLAFNPFTRGGRETSLGDEEGMKLVQQCVLRCKEPAFANWLLGPPKGRAAWSEDEVVSALYRRLGITSRRQIGTDLRARNAWKALIGSYMEETRFGPPA